MKNHITAELHPTLSGIRAELLVLRESIPMFASWLVPELSRISRRYSEILACLIVTETYRVICKELVQSNFGIQASVREAVETGDWRPFNKAVLALQWDMDELVRILPA